ncbi:MAG: hypothetical protein IKT38_00265 [Clostridia bacterium]|nr:hypothetical protein [Clostridia bacterium]
MKVSFKGIICILVSICIVLTALPIMFGVMADSTEPELSNRCDMVISEDGTNTDFGSKYNDLPTKTRITLSPVIDLSAYENFEFDIYVEDAVALIDAIENTPGNNPQGIGFYFSSATNTTLSLTRNQAYFDFTEQIIADGWNHISFSKSDLNFSATAINWGSIKYIFLKFSDNITNAYGDDLKETTIKLRNICTILDIPEIAEGNTVIYSDFLKNKLGKNENSLYSEIASSFTVSDIESVDISKNTHIGIDFKVSDFEKFNALIDNEDIFARLGLITDNGNILVEFDSIRNGAKSGWYNMIAALGSTKPEKITGFYFELVNSENGAKLGENHALVLSIANIYGINIAKTDANTLYGEAVTNFGVQFKEISSGKAYKDFKIFANGNFDSINNSEYIEFDLYIEDYESFKNSFSKDAGNTDISVDLQLSVSNNEDLNGNTLTFSNIQEKIVYSGFNHIILPISSGVNNGFDNSDTIKSYSLEISGANKDNKTSYAQKIVIIDSLYATKYQTPDASNKYDEISVLSENGKQWNMGNTFANSSTGEYHLTNAANFSEAMFVEFDIYIQNYDALMSVMQKGNVKGITMSFSSTNTNDYTKDSRSTNFLKHITHSGWNHICIPLGDFQKGNTSGTLDISKISTYRVYYNGTTSSETSVLKGQYVSVANIGGYAIKVPSKYAGENDVKANLNAAATSGTYGGNYSLSISSAVSEPIDFSGCSYIEFDIYIENYEEFKNSFKIDADGKAVGVDLKFGIGMTTVYADSNGYYEWGSIQNKITHSGWNHIVLDIDSRSRSKGEANNKKTIENIQCFKMWYGGDAYKKGDYQNLIGDTVVIIANICSANIRLPELPNNVLAQIGTYDSATLGGYFHDAEYRLFEEKLTAVDFSKGTAIEFDIYIDDYEALLAAEEASATNYSGLERTRNSKLALFISSTPAGLWGQYEKPRNYFSAYITISDKITHSGWNHVVVGRADFIAHKQNLDWSNITAWNVAFTAGSNVHKEVNPSPNVMVSICNIVNTGVVSDIPKDNDKTAYPDKNAAYISDAETLSDSNGTWNPSAVYVDEDYKSEGKASIQLKLTYRSEVEEAFMYYLFDETADISDIKTLNFDFFVDLPQFIQASGNKAEIVIANHRNANDNYYKWNMNFDTLKSGWNSFALDINKAAKSGNPNLREAKVIMLRFTELNIDAKVFAEIVIGLDNLRYISSVGNKTLKINSDDLSNMDSGYINDTDFSTDGEIVDEGPLVITSDPETKNIKNMKRLIYQDYLSLGIILGIETVGLLAAAGLFILIYCLRKKKKSV